MSAPQFLVLGATGNQGRAVVHALLARGHAVRAFVRNPESTGAKALATAGASLAVGSYDHPATLEAAAQDVAGVFVNTSPFLPGVGMDGEVAHGRVIVEALKRARVPHVVYSSISDADRSTGVPHFESKWATEQLLAASGLSYTVTGPVFFSDNLTSPWTLPGLAEGVLRQAMSADRPLQVVSLAEIGQLNAAVLVRGTALAGRRINFAGDVVTPAQMADILTRATGRPIAFHTQPIAELDAFNTDMAAMYRWFEDVGYTADIAALRSEFPDVEWRSFEAWATAQPWASLLAAVRP